MSNKQKLFGTLTKSYAFSSFTTSILAVFTYKELVGVGTSENIAFVTTGLITIVLAVGFTNVTRILRYDPKSKAKRDPQRCE